ncbi:hypothetical protein K7432_006562 [Basidiobolus ranarum]|uniref:Uncharacterized protein n=1 Tax=Basidiobolus ranarum TaxID=34480 RepID=A0ABR2WUT0_9FUNG
MSQLVIKIALLGILGTLNNSAVGYLFQTKSGLDGDSWKEVKNLGFNQISMGFDDSVWGVTSGEEVYRLNDERKSWNKLPGQLVQVSGLNRDHAWGLDNKGHIYRYSEGLWNQINGRLITISASTTDEYVQSVEHLWGIDNHSHLVYCAYQRTVRGCKWKLMKTPEHDLKPAGVAALGDGQVFVIFAKKGNDKKLMTYRWDKKHWTRVKHLNLKRINGSSGRQIVGLDHENQIQVYSLDKDEWIHVDSPTDCEVTYPAVGKTVTVITDQEIPPLPPIKIVKESKVAPAPDVAEEIAEQNGIPPIAAQYPYSNGQFGMPPSRGAYSGFHRNNGYQPGYHSPNRYGGYIIPP